MLKKLVELSNKFGSDENYVLAGGGNTSFKDADYLSVLLERKGVDLTKEEDVKKAILELKEEKPEQFVVTVNSGSGAGGEPNNQGSGEKPTFKNQEERVDYIAKHGFEEYQKITGE